MQDPSSTARHPNTAAVMYRIRHRIEGRETGNFDAGDFRGAPALFQFRVRGSQHDLDVVVARTAAFLARSVPLHVRFVDRTEGFESDPFGLVRVVRKCSRMSTRMQRTMVQAIGVAKKQG